MEFVFEVTAGVFAGPTLLVGSTVGARSYGKKWFLLILIPLATLAVLSAAIGIELLVDKWDPFQFVFFAPIAATWWSYKLWAKRPGDKGVGVN